MLNLTRQERLVIQFLVAFFLIGGAIHLYKANFVKAEIVNADEVDKEKEQFKVMADRVDSIYFASRSKATQKNDEKISTILKVRSFKEEKTYVLLSTL